MPEREQRVLLEMRQVGKSRLAGLFARYAGPENEEGVTLGNKLGLWLSMKTKELAQVVVCVVVCCLMFIDSIPHFSR